jgi:excisionase family DNA binding protein
MDEQNITSRVLTVAEVAGRLRVSQLTVYRLIHRGHIRAYKVGQLWRIDQDDLEAYIQAQKSKNNKTTEVSDC